MDTLPIDQLGARETTPGHVEFRVLLPWVSPSEGNAVFVKVIHERDQFIRAIPARVFPLQHQRDPVWGDVWFATLAIAADGDASAWGEPGKYVYRFTVSNPRVGEVDFVSDPFAREFGVGRLSAFTLGFTARAWAATEDSWIVPPLSDLVMYEMMVSEFARDIGQATQQLRYIRDLGINCLSLMPLSNVAPEVDWGYLPTGYFGVDERFGRNRADLQGLVERAHALGIAVIADVVYGHTSELFPYSYLYRRLGYAENPFLGAFAADYFGESTDFRKRFTRAFFHTVNEYWLDRYHLDGFRQQRAVPDRAVQLRARVEYHRLSRQRAPAKAASQAHEAQELRDVRPCLRTRAAIFAWPSSCVCDGHETDPHRLCHARRTNPPHR